MLFTIQNQDHTIASILRDQLFKFDITFGSCTKYHPQDNCINVSIESSNDDPRNILDMAVQNALNYIDEINSIIDNYNIHTELVT